MHAAGLRGAHGDGAAAGEKDSPSGSLGRGEARLCVVRSLHAVTYILLADLPCAYSSALRYGGLISVCIIVGPLSVLEGRADW